MKEGSIFICGEGMASEFTNALKLYKGLKKLYLHERFVYSGRYKRGWWCYRYIEKHIKKPYPPLEPLILTDRCATYFYAKNVIRGRYLAGEEFLSKCKNRFFWNLYVRNIKGDNILNIKIY